MNKHEIKTVESHGKLFLLYSHDDAFTRYRVEIDGNKYACFINENQYFKHGTHEKTARLFGFELNDMEHDIIRALF